jgi:hypothetical protein
VNRTHGEHEPANERRLRARYARNSARTTRDGTRDNTQSTRKSDMLRARSRRGVDWGRRSSPRDDGEQRGGAGRASGVTNDGEAWLPARWLHDDEASWARCGCGQRSRALCRRLCKRMDAAGTRRSTGRRRDELAVRRGVVRAQRLNSGCERRCMGTRRGSAANMVVQRALARAHSNCAERGRYSARPSCETTRRGRTRLWPRWGIQGE